MSTIEVTVKRGRGRPPRVGFVPYVVLSQSKGPNPWQAAVRGPQMFITYLGFHATREAAVSVADRFIATGERPEPKKRGCIPRIKTSEERDSAVQKKREASRQIMQRIRSNPDYVRPERRASGLAATTPENPRIAALKAIWDRLK